MGKTKVRSIIVTCMMILFCTALVVGSTVALWSDSVRVENHLTAGSLKVKLERTSLTKTSLDEETGYLTVTEDSQTVDLTDTDTGNINVFGIGANEKIIPGAYYAATLRLTNDGDVSFGYDIIIKLTSASNALAEQLKVFVDGTDKGYLSAFTGNDGVAIISTQTMAKNDGAKVFSVKIAFDDLDENNAAQNEQASFDLLINAVQLTAEP